MNPPAQLFVNVEFPQPGPVQLNVEMRGKISWMFVPQGSDLIDKHLSVQFGAGGPVVAATFTNDTDWHCSGRINPALPAGHVDLTLNVDAQFRTGFLFTMTLTQSTFIPVMLFRVPPRVACDDFPRPVIAQQLPQPFTFTGTASSSEAPVQLVQYKVENGQFGNAINVSGDWSRWQVSLPLPPTTPDKPHVLTVRVFDQLGSSAEQSQSFEVQPATPIDVPPGTRTTLSGAPTSSSVTSWTRLEPRCSDADLGVSAGARVFDPLWMLARQWQMGEFQAEDAGTPVQARVRATSAMLTRCVPGDLLLTAAGTLAAPAPRYDPLAVPLDVVVEKRPMRPVDTSDLRMLRFAIDAGLHFLRMLALQPLSLDYRSAFLTRFALEPRETAEASTPDEATARYVRGMVGRAPDARRIAELLRTSGAAQLVLEPALGIALPDRAEVQQAATSWLAWYDSLCSEPAGASTDAWNASRLEYAVSVGTKLSADEGGDVTLTAKQVDGPLDWSSFDVDRSVSLTSADGPQVRSHVETTIPAPVGFPGAPSPRFWEMEDANVAYGLVPVGPTDLGHLLMIEYVSSYGNDWFVIPLTLPVGSIARVDSLVVTDTFGIQSLVRPIGDPALPPPFFSLWQPTIRAPARVEGLVLRNLFFLPPTLGRTLDGGPLEDVLFLRDEAANLAWAIERSIENAIEQPAPRDAEGPATSTEHTPLPDRPVLPRYRLSSEVPANWIPLLPIQRSNPQAPNQLSSLLERGAVLQPDGSENVHEALGEILNAGEALHLFDEEVPREGVRVTRRRRLARWTDGSTWLWTALRPSVGCGEGGSGLQFDRVLEPGGADAGSHD